MALSDYIATVGDGAISGDTVTRLWMCRKADAVAIFEAYEHNEEYDDGFFNLFASGIAYNEAYATLTMVFQANPTEDEHEAGDVEYSCNASTFEKPLESRANYRTIWNHDLWAKNGVPVSVGTWNYAIATDTVIPDALQGTVKWGDSDAPPEGWHIAIARTKPGVQAFNYPAPVVSVTEYFKKRKDAAAKVRKIGRLSAPGYCFGYNIASKYWLINNSTMSREGRLWVVTTEHIYADTGWDEDLYS